MKDTMGLANRSQEQRDFHRMAINAGATLLYAQNNQMLRQPALCKDLSATGLSLKVGVELAEGDDIEVVIEGKDGQSLDIKAKILRVSKDEDGDYILGCAITSMR